MLSGVLALRVPWTATAYSVTLVDRKDPARRLVLEVEEDAQNGRWRWRAMTAKLAVFGHGASSADAMARAELAAGLRPGGARQV